MAGMLHMRINRLYGVLLVGLALRLSFGGPPATQPNASGVLDSTIRFLEARVHTDPDDIVALNRLAGCYLQKLTDTADLQFLRLARHTADRSLKAVPADANPGGLAAKARADLAAHEFAAARDAAEQLLKLAPEKAYPYEILGDALLELGEYDKARNAYSQMESISSETVNTQTRLGQQAWIHGGVDEAREHLQAGLDRATHIGPGAARSIGWCHVQLGDIAFAAGDYLAAEKHFRDATDADARYALAWGCIAKSRAAQGDAPGAISNYEHALQIQPDVAQLAALGDLYELTGQSAKAKQQFAVIDVLAETTKQFGVAPDRRYIYYWADHGIEPAATYEAAKANYAARHGVKDADALAWAALQAGKLDEAQRAIAEALRLGTPDPQFFYHAGLIALARGDKAAARIHLEHVRRLSPQFDPRQSRRAKAELEGLK